jgi:hypothetical protein
VAGRCVEVKQIVEDMVVGLVVREKCRKEILVDPETISIT